MGWFRPDGEWVSPVWCHTYWRRGWWHKRQWRVECECGEVVADWSSDIEPDPHTLASAHLKVHKDPNAKPLVARAIPGIFPEEEK